MDRKLSLPLGEFYVSCTCYVYPMVSFHYHKACWVTIKDKWQLNTMAAGVLANYRLHQDKLHKFSCMHVCFHVVLFMEFWFLYKSYCMVHIIFTKDVELILQSYNTLGAFLASYIVNRKCTDWCIFWSTSARVAICNLCVSNYEPICMNLIKVMISHAKTLLV